MSSGPSEPPPRPKRPWFLLATLIITWVLGAAGFVDGCNTLAFYRADHVEETAFTETIDNDELRESANEAAGAYIATMHEERNRAFPIAIATLLLGAAMVVVSARAMGGRGSARPLLMQLMVAQTAVAVASFVLTPRVRAASLALETSLAKAQLAKTAPDPSTEQDSVKLYERLARVRGPIFLGLRTAATGLILIALTRRRTLEFYTVVGRAP